MPVVLLGRLGPWDKPGGLGAWGPGTGSEMGQIGRLPSARAGPDLLIQLSNSPRSRASRWLPYRRAPSPPLSVARGPAPSLPFSLTCVRGAERRKALRSSSGTFLRCRAPCYRHAHLPALHCGDFLPDHRVFFHRTGDLHLTLSRQHWRCLSSDVVQATEGGPLIGGGRRPCLLGRGYEPRLQAPHPAPPLSVPSRRPHVSKVGGP